MNAWKYKINAQANPTWTIFHYSQASYGFNNPRIILDCYDSYCNYMNATLSITVNTELSHKEHRMSAVASWSPY